jgi:hypothetical protein
MGAIGFNTTGFAAGTSAQVFEYGLTVGFSGPLAVAPWLALGGAWILIAGAMLLRRKHLPL